MRNASRSSDLAAAAGALYAGRFDTAAVAVAAVVAEVDVLASRPNVLVVYLAVDTVAPDASIVVFEGWTI